MINHHPTDAVLKEFIAGNLPVSISVIVSSHIEMCAECQAKVNRLTEEMAQDLFGLESSQHLVNSQHLDNSKHIATPDSANLSLDNALSQIDLSHLDISDSGDNLTLDMISAITEQPVEQANNLPQTITEIEVSGKRLPLPRAMRSIALKEWQGLGKVSRARLNLDDGERRTSLLHIDKLGTVPSHTHKGFEITLLLEGSFEDEMGTYSAGDFIWLDGEHTHSPVTKEGCVCLTVSDNALHFTQGVSQLFNPLGKLIY